MKKILLSILMLLLTVTAAWAGEGDGTKDHPFSGVWQASELASRIDKGKNLYLAYDCDIQSGSITVIDSKLNTQIANGWPAWSPGNVLGSSNYSGYDEYYKNNSLGDRKSQLFIVTDASGSGSTIYMTGYFSGSYDLANIVLPKKEVDNVEYYVINSDEDYETFRNIVATGNPYANAVLEANITVTKPIGGGAPQFHYRGTFDGQGHTIDVDSLANDNENHPWGVFQFTEPGCVIRNIKVTGKLTSDHEYLGSIVGEARGTRIENCISDAKLKNTSSTLPVTGGLIGAGHGVNFIENCAFIGEIDAEKEACGIIGKVVNNVEIRSCYVDARFSNPEKSNQIMFKDDDTQILMNCYYCDNDGTNYLSGLGLISASKDDLSKGKCSRLLNLKGRKGVVWYQHGDHPYPFKGEDGQLVVGEHIGIECAPEHYFESNGICLGCGALDPNKNVAPLQLIRPFIGEANDDDEIKINNLRFKTNEKRGLTTAELRGYYNNEALTAVHIPETINVNGEVYTIDYIASDAFKDSKIEYCYIPKTVNHINNNAFNGCSNLKYLHIADCPSTAGKLLLEHKGENDALFTDSPLETVYIGRDLRWYTNALDFTSDEPFHDKDKITDVFFGPRVSRIGNYYDTDARAGFANEIFDDCDGIKRVYFMGDEQSIDTKVEVWSDEGLIDATDYYVNRTIKTTGDSKEYVTYHDNGIMLNCEDISFGPFVKEIGYNLLGGDMNHDKIKSVDLSNTFHLETIGADAFKRCTAANFNADMSKSKLKSIGSDAFYKCENLGSVRFGSKLQSIGTEAFRYCTDLAYISIPGTVTSIGVDAFSDCESLLGVKFEDSDTSLDHDNIHARFRDSKKIAAVYIGRDIDGTTSAEYSQYSFFGSSKESLTSVELGPKVTMVPKCAFSGVTAIKSISFDYSSEPLKFQESAESNFYALGENYNQISSLFIDRKLVDKDGNEIVGDKWGYLRETVNTITFGEHITRVGEFAFTNFKHLNNIFLPRAMLVGGDAFSGCESLKSLVILGASIIGVNAFANCKELETVIIGDSNLKLNENAFANCNKIKDITINSDGWTAESAGNAFSDTAYEYTKLYSTFDTSTETVVFESEPWSKFQNHPVKRNHDYTENSGTNQGTFEHASITHKVSEGQYEAFYAPFQWDSYYFGADAEVYTLNINDNNSFAEDVNNNNILSIRSIKVDTVDISKNRTLPIGIYFVKTNYPAETLHATRNLFSGNGVMVNNANILSHNPSEKYEVGRGGSSRDVEPDKYILKDYYLFEDGVMKLLNGKHFMQSGVVYIYSSRYDREEDIYNISKNDGATLFSSKRPVPIHSLLEGYATFYNEKYNVLAPSWCEVYVVTGEENGEVSMAQIEDRVITAGQAVIIKTKKEEAIGAEDFLTYVTNGSQATDLYSRNLLRGVSEDTQVDDICGGDGFVYVLSCNSKYENTGFYKLGIGNTLGAGKAYLLPSDFSDADLAKACLFSFSGGANGIKSTSESMSESDYIYDLSGKRINANQMDAKGIYIIDSKKVVK